VTGAGLARIAWRAAAPLLVLALVAGSALGQGADSLTEMEQRRQLEMVKRQARENREASERLRPRQTAAIKDLQRTEKSLTSTRRRLKNLSQQRTRLDSQLEMTRADLQQSIESLDDARGRLGRRLRNMYKYGPARDLELVFSTTSFGQLISRWDYMVMVSEQDRLLMEDVRARKELVERLENRLEGHLRDVDRTSRQTTSENQRLAQQRKQKASTVKEIQTQRQAYEAAAAELERTARQIQSLLARLESKRKEAEKGGRAPVPYTGDFARGQGSLEWPLRGEVVGRFGPETHPRFNTTTMNNGIDIRAEIGTAVRAVAKGRVDYTSEDFGTYGQMIILNHGDGFYTLYGHLSEISVSNGQEINSGQVIGRSGDTGSLKGPVLHFEVRRGASPQNPQSWLR
jgi:murein DD-endopeptidase MepM/ murein hydrolase activator NlpD